MLYTLFMFIVGFALFLVFLPKLIKIIAGICVFFFFGFALQWLHHINPELYPEEQRSYNTSSAIDLRLRNNELNGSYDLEQVKHYYSNLMHVSYIDPKYNFSILSLAINKVNSNPELQAAMFKVAIDNDSYQGLVYQALFDDCLLNDCLIKQASIIMYYNVKDKPFFTSKLLMNKLDTKIALINKLPARTRQLAFDLVASDSFISDMHRFVNRQFYDNNNPNMVVNITAPYVDSFSK